MSSKQYLDEIRDTLRGKRITEVLLPPPDAPFDEIEFVLDDGNRVMLCASSNDGSGTIAWGVNVPSDSYDQKPNREAASL